MRVLLQHSQTKRYLGRSGNWTDDPAMALAFLDEVRARDYSIYRRILDAQVVVHDESRSSESVRVTETLDTDGAKGDALVAEAGTRT